MSGKKYDMGKLRWDLLPIDVIEDVVKVLTLGAEKYGPNNWKDVDSFRYDAALLRHYAAWKKGEKTDGESEVNHLAHLICNALFLLSKDKA